MNGNVNAPGVSWPELREALKGKAPLDSEGKVPKENLPAMDYLPLSGGEIKAEGLTQSLLIYPDGIVVNGADGEGVRITNDDLDTGNGYVDGTPVLGLLGSLADESVILRNVAGPVQGGDAANKQYVDDALNALKASTKDVFQVGDTVTTARHGLGSKWLLCNGEPIFSEPYPNLFSVLSQTQEPNLLADRDYLSPPLESPDGVGFTSVVCGNGYYLMFAEHSSANSQSGVYTWYRPTDGSDEWKAKRDAASWSASYDAIKFVNGLFIIISSAGIYFKETPTDSWTLAPAPSKYRFNDIIFDNGEYIVCGYRTQTFLGNETTIPVVMTASALSSQTTWTDVSVGSLTDTSLEKIVKYKGYYLFPYLTSNNRALNLLYTNDLHDSNAFSSREVVFSASPNPSAKRFLTDGSHLIYYTTSTIFMADSMEAEFVQSTQELFQSLGTIRFQNGKYICLGTDTGDYTVATGVVAAGTDLKDPTSFSKQHFKYVGSETGAEGVLSLVDIPKRFQADETNMIWFPVKGTSYTINLYSFTSENAVFLPTISVADHVSTYIKAKE